jgi:hypothetical protein
MHGPWHMPEHPDEADNSEYERELDEYELLARLDAHAACDAAAPLPPEEQKPGDVKGGGA